MAITENMQSHPETSATTSTEITTSDLLTLFKTLPDQFNLLDLLSESERSRVLGFGSLPHAAIASALGIAKERREPDFDFEAVQAYLDEAERLAPVLQLITVFQQTADHVRDHMAQFREPAAKETLALYEVLKGKARVRRRAELRQQVAELAGKIPQAGKRVKHRDVVVDVPVVEQEK